MKRLLLIIGLLLGCAFPAFAKPLYLIPIGPAFACRSVGHALHCVIANVQGYEVATTLTIPNSFTPNTPALSAQVNQNFNTIASWANGNVDNSNIGASGIYASQIIPISAGTATFGGAQQYTFATVLNMNGQAVATTAGDAGTPFTINGHSATQSADLLDIFRSPAGPLQLSVNSSGNMSTQGVVYAAPTATPATSAVFAQNDNGTINGLTFNVPTSSTNAYVFEIGGVKTAQLDSTGGFSVFSQSAGSIPLFAKGAVSQTTYFRITTSTNSTVITDTQLNGMCLGWGFNSNVCNYVPITMTSNGSNPVVASNTYHLVDDSCNFSASSACSVSLTGDAAFTNTTVYSCYASGTSNVQQFIISETSGSAFTITSRNASTGALSSITQTVPYHCAGY